MTEPQTQARNWVWRSTPDSLKKGQVSVLACVETALATIVGLYLAFAWNFTYFLFTSLILTFLVNLRSPQSVALGLKWFEAYISSSQQPFNLAEVPNFLISFCTGSLIYYYYFISVPDAEFWIVFYALLLFSLPVLAAQMVTAVSPGVVPAISSTLGALAVFLCTFDYTVSFQALFTSIPVLFVTVIPLGIALIALGIRFFATLRYAHIGVWRFSQNWRNFALRLDIIAEVELIPGISSPSHLKDASYNPNFFYSSGLQRMRKPTNNTAAVSLRNFYLYIFFILPTYIYRLILKSSFWMYFPILWLAHAPVHMRADGGGLIWDKSHGRSVGDKLALVSSLGVIIWSLWSLWNHDSYTAAQAWADRHEGLSGQYLFILGFEWGQLGFWQWPSFIAASLAFVILFWSSELQRRSVNWPDFHPSRFTLRLMYVVNKFKNGLTIIVVAGGIFTVLYYLYDTCTLPPPVQILIAYVTQAPESCS
ncbi:hypothetical protein [Cochlodiniinecator piscidefendens]|uniref:hypothetical protein n=1 Tax=Cochlodiniinecator piscidefendens TaxID=2715756 RepID=UPI00140973EC|nr:hypothetical protein [Cochlodiniinecator piscidefendens]